MESTLTFGQCLAPQTPPLKARVSDVDGGRPIAISGRSQAAIDAAALAIFVYRSQEARPDAE